MPKKAKETEEEIKEPVAETLETVEEVQEVSETPEKEKVIAKAGKRSAKAIKEVEQKEAKEERKVHTKDEETAKPKQAAKPTRTRLERSGKKLRKVAEQIEKNKLYNIGEAVELATKTSPAKFDATVELHVNLNVDPRQSDQNIRDNLVLPAGTGKKVRVAVFADGTFADADSAGIETILKQLEKGTIDFDVLLATPASMPKLGKYARLLGPRGLMPNPKSGTVTNDVAKALKEAKGGRVEYRVDSTGIVHLGIGKVSFGKTKLEQNAQAVFTSIKNNKPNSVKSGYIKSAFVTTTMGPSIRLSISEL